MCVCVCVCVRACACGCVCICEIYPTYNPNINMFSINSIDCAVDHEYVRIVSNNIPI